MAHAEATLPDERRGSRWAAVVDGRNVGVLEVGFDQGSFHPSRWQVDLSVVPDTRGRGVGTALFAHAESLLAGKPVDKVSTRVQDIPPALNFAINRGFLEVKRDFWSVLDLGTVDGEVVKGFRSKLPPDVEVRCLAEVDSQELRRAAHDLFEAVRVDIPRSDPPTPLTFEEFESLVLDDPALDRDCTLYAFQKGRLVASTAGFVSPTPQGLDQGLTAVRRDARGRGIAQAIKAELILRAQKKGYALVRTDNDSRNSPILSINDRLGFKRLPATVIMERSGQQK